MLRIAVVDDEREYSDILKEFIDRYCRENGEEAHVVSFSDGIDIASDYTAQYDIIFLDIAMKHMDGLKTARYIRKKDKNVIIVFVTAAAQHAIDGYAVEALSYIIKPVGYEVFAREFTRCIEKMKSGRGRYIIISTENGMDRVAVDEIEFIESQNHKMIINTTQTNYCVYETMKSLESKLPNEQFSRCNNCYLVNIEHVRGVHGEYAVIGGAELKISRSRRKGFLEDVEKYYNGK